MRNILGSSYIPIIPLLQGGGVLLKHTIHDGVIGNSTFPELALKPRTGPTKIAALGEERWRITMHIPIMDIVWGISFILG